MALSITNSQHSFVRFGDSASPPYCYWGDVKYCLPVYSQGDIAFQFIVTGTTAEEISALCNPYTAGATISLVDDCNGDDLIVFDEYPDRFLISPFQVLFNWSHGLPNFTSVIAVGECFHVRVRVEGAEWCSNCFQRIAEDCYTAVVEYGNEEDGFGFKYCYSGEVPTPSGECLPTIASFTDVETLDIPYTASMREKYGDFPTVQAWIDDGNGNLTNFGITIQLDANPPTNIHFDFGGVATGVVIIR